MKEHAELKAGKGTAKASPVPPSGSLSHQRRLGEALLGAGVQPKLRLGAAGDAQEVEAERVAAHVLREPAPDAADAAIAAHEPGLAPQIRCKKIKVGDPELPSVDDLNFSIATLVEEASAAGPLSEKAAIAIVVKKRTELRWGGRKTFKAQILAQAYGNPSRKPLPHLAKLYLDHPAANLKGFCKLVDRSHQEKAILPNDLGFLQTETGFRDFTRRINEAAEALKSVLNEEEQEEPLPVVAEEATWWGGEIDLWNHDKDKGRVWKHGMDVLVGKLVFALYHPLGTTYFFKEARSIADKEAREAESERSIQFLWKEMLDKSGLSRAEIIKKNPQSKKYLEPAKPPGKAKAAGEEAVAPMRHPSPPAIARLSSPLPGDRAEVASEDATSIKGAIGKGNPLPESERTFFESRFGTPFGSVRVHNDAEADRLNQSLNSRAFTLGGDIFFQKGEYSPGTGRGRELLAHELVHVVQQGGVGGEGVFRAAPATAGKEGGDGRLEDVMSWTVKLYGLPYGFSADDTWSTLKAKKVELGKAINAKEKEIRKLRLGKGDDAQKKELADAEQELAKSRQMLSEIDPAMDAARTAYWDKTLKETLSAKTGPVSQEVLSALNSFGLVCDTFVSTVMRLSGFADFPIAGAAYLPGSERYRQVEEERDKARKVRPGWALDWGERMADWGMTHGEVIYDASDPGKQTLPKPQQGDIVIFGTGGKVSHVNLVVAEGEGKFNFAGAARAGKSSGTALWGFAFASYDERVRSKDLPALMVQDKYLWILRPAYKGAEKEITEKAP